MRVTLFLIGLVVAEQVHYASSSSNKCLVQVAADSPPRWILEEDKGALRRAGVRFMDITEYQDLGSYSVESVRDVEYPTKASYQKQVNKSIKNLEIDNMKSNLQ